MSPRWTPCGRVKPACMSGRMIHALPGRLASLGFLPGVAVRMLRNAKRGPLLVLARHTRVALGREIASGIVVARKG